MDCKLVATEHALGELLIQVKHLNHHSGIESKQSNAMLFGPFGCHLIICQGQELIYREVVEWTTPGSRNRLKEFFPPLKWNLSPLLQRFDVQIAEPQQAGETAFLGSGGFGRVVHVIHNSGSHYALKVVDMIHRERIYH